MNTIKKLLLMKKIYKLKEEITPKDLDKKGDKFKPYRSIVAWYCWRALEK
jgi:DNA-3-methyladenine glycosylase II